MKKNAIAIACAAVIALVLVLPLGLAGLLRPQAAVNNQGATQDSGQSASAQAVVPEQQETSAEASSDSSGNSPDEPEYVPGVVLVGISDDASIDQVNERLQQLDYVATKSISEEELLYGYAEITLAEGVEVDDAVALLEAEDCATASQPNYVYHLLDTEEVESASDGASSVVANADGLLVAQHIDMSAQATTISDPDRSKQWGLQAIKAYDAWDKAKGNHKVTVAVLDSGLDMNHPDFADANNKTNVISPYSVLQANKHGNTSNVADALGHGTHVAGIISAGTNNGVGVAGVSYNANIMPVQVIEYPYIDDNGRTTNRVTSADAAKGVNYIVNHKNADPSAPVRVINVSFGTTSSYTPAAGDDRLFTSALQSASQANILVVYAAGNGGSNGAYTCFPCDADSNGIGVISVQQSGTKYVRTNTSNYNKAGETSKEVSAPGQSIYSTWIDSTYRNDSGTSMAAPFVSGTAALAFAANPNLKASDVKQIIVDTATDLTPSNSGSETSVGFDRYTGYGMVNAKAAVDAALNSGGGGSSGASSLANATVTLSQSRYTYNGSVQKPTVTVKLGYTTLTAGSDYTVVFPSDSTNAGAKTITVKPGTNGKYSGTKTASYTIDKKSASIMAKSKTKTYDGTALTASSAGYTASGFVKASDYSSGVSLSGSITNVGSTTARVTFTPSATVKSNYNVTLYSGTLRVTAASLSSVSVSPSSYNYDGKVKNPTVTVYGPNGKRLTSGVDYTIIAPAGRTVVGTYKYSITGKGNYSGTKTASFNISKGVVFWKRIWGSKALDTMKSIVDAGEWAKGGTVVLVTDANYYDGLTANGVAGLAGSPIVMTDGKTLSSQARSVISSLRPTSIIVCGGSLAVTDSVVSAARSAAGTSPKVTRLWGQHADDTAVSIYKQGTSAAGGSWSTTAFVCTDKGYWDALSAAPISYAKHMPIFLTTSEGTKLSSSTVSAMKSGGIKRVYIVGGELAVAPAVAAQLKSAGITVADRLWGQHAVDTSVKVAKFGLSLGMSANGMGIATTGGYWDALAGSALCGRNGAIIALVDGPTSPAISGVAKANASAIACGYVFGGTSVVSAATYNALPR